jgi:hypothetical protein
VETDPYGAAFFEDDECEDDDDMLAAPIITRSGTLEHLEIDSIINLAEPILIARFNDQSSTSIKGKSATKIEVSQKNSQKWSASNTNWATSDDFDF